MRVSRSSVSREASQAAEAEMEKLLSRDWSAVELLVIYLGGDAVGLASLAEPPP